MVSDIRIRAFRATEDRETCERYIVEHRKVLEIYGISNISTNTEDWIFNKSIFVIVIESLDGEELYGGARLQVADGIHPLPMEEAAGKMDARVYDVVKYFSQFGAAELSGLWNSKKVAGFGIGSLFPSRVALALTDQLGIQTLFCLCSPTTLRFRNLIGGMELISVGNNGTFYYPKADLVATIMYSDDMVNLPLAIPSEKEKILFLRKNLKHKAIEKSPLNNQDLTIHYEIGIHSAFKEEFKLKIHERV